MAATAPFLLRPGSKGARSGEAPPLPRPVSKGAKVGEAPLLMRPGGKGTKAGEAPFLLRPSSQGVGAVEVPCLLRPYTTTSAEAAAPLDSMLPPVLEACRPEWRRRRGEALRRSIQDWVHSRAAAADSDVAAVLRANTVGKESTGSLLSSDTSDARTARSQDGAATSIGSKDLDESWSSASSFSAWREQALHRLRFTTDGGAASGHLRFLDSCRVIARGDFLEGLGEQHEDKRELAEHRWDITRETGWIHRQQAHERMQWRRQQQRRAARGEGQTLAEEAVAEQAEAEEAAEATEEERDAGSGTPSTGQGQPWPSNSSSSSLAEQQQAPAPAPPVATPPTPAEDGPTRPRGSRGSLFRRSSVMFGGPEASAPPTPGERQESSRPSGSLPGESLGLQRRSTTNSIAAIPEKEREPEEKVRMKEPEMKCILKKLKLKTRREKRLERLSALQCTHLQQSRMARLIDLRHRDFESLPAAEQQALRSAFQTADVDELGALTARQLKNALKGVGLRPRSDSERTEVMLLCNEVAVAGDVDFLGFVFETVPRARERLREIRRPGLQQHFQLYDKDRTGQLNVDECTAIFERLCMWDLDSEGAKAVRKTFEEKLRKARDATNGQVPFANFEPIMAEVREQTERAIREGEARVEKKEWLDEAELKAHREELLSMHESYRRAASEGILSRQRLRPLLLERGLWSPDASVQQKLEQIVEAMVEESERQDGHLTFKHFLKAARFMREMIVAGNHFELSQMFTRLDKARRGFLHPPAIKNLIGLLGIKPQRIEDQAELSRLLSEANNGSGEVGFPEFERLVLKVRERMKAAQRFRAVKTAQELRFKEAEVEHFMEHFNLVDTEGSGQLTAEQLDRVMELMHRPVNGEDKEAILARLLGEVPHTGRVLDLEAFLRYVRATSALTPQSM